MDSVEEPRQVLNPTMAERQLYSVQEPGSGAGLANQLRLKFCDSILLPLYGYVHIGW